MMAFFNVYRNMPLSGITLLNALLLYWKLVQISLVVFLLQFFVYIRKLIHNVICTAHLVTMYE